MPHLPPPPPPLPPSRGARRWLVALVAVVVGIAIITGIALVTRGGDDEIAAYDGPYPDAAEQNFTIACTATSGGRADYCRCVLRHIEQQLSYAEFLELDRRFRTPGATVPNLQRYAAGCLPPVTRQA